MITDSNLTDTFSGTFVLVILYWGRFSIGNCTVSLSYFSFSLHTYDDTLYKIGSFHNSIT